MNSLKSLGAFVVGAIVVSILYGVALGDKDAAVSFEFDDGQGVRHIVNGDRGEFVMRDDDLSIEASWRGNYALNKNGDDIAELDHRLEITKKENDAAQRAVFENDGGDIERSYYIDGEKQEWSAQSEDAVRELLLAFFRASGVKADERVVALSSNGGPDAVLEEMSLLYGDHARQRYVTALTEYSDLNSGQRRVLFDMAADMDSDHDIRRTLQAIIEHETITAEDWPQLFDAAQKIESDFDLRRLVESVAELELEQQSVQTALDLIARMESDHDIRRASEALLEQDAFGGPGAVRLLTVAAAGLESDHDIRILLTQTAPFLSAHEDVSEAWLGAFAQLESDHDKRIALEEAADINGLTDSAASKMIAATRDIGSDHEHRLALSAFSARAERNAELRAVYLSSAETISSDRAREQALEAIGVDTND
ncbi:hypothetical protein [Hyphococcus sp.]|uniref:hypothetical protein n=1 Tax=Hyphococcus sp. TaxID=2038636 RepID=UPI003CCBE29A